MIDHLLGRPSQGVKRIQVLLVLLAWAVYLQRGHAHGPHLIRRLSKHASKQFTAWQVMCLTMSGMYLLKNLDRMIGLGNPEPLARLYTRSFYRATWVLTALDAGFWTAMPLKPVWLRDIASILFSAYYMVFADQADEKVRKFKCTATVEQLRVSMGKVTTPYLKFLIALSKPRLKIKRKLIIPRKSAEPSQVWLYFNGTEEELKLQRKLVFFVHGGGFIAMNPECYEEVTFAWATQLNIPIVAIDYKKAQEYPFPYALHECRDLYLEILATNGRVLGFQHSHPLKIAVSGDSAGGNIATSLVILLLTEHTQVPPPAGLVLIYPALDLNLTCWMSDEHMCLLRQESTRDVPDAVINSKLNYEKRKSVLQPYPDNNSPHKSRTKMFFAEETKSLSTEPKTKNTGTRLAMTSRVSFFQDRIMSPEMLRAMVLLYVGPQNRPDFETDYLLCPLRAPTEVLAKFPKTYLLCGEKDAMVDDTVILAGRIREAKKAALARRHNLQMTSLSDSEMDCVEILLFRGVSHGFMQMASILPQAKKAISKCEGWLKEILEDSSPMLHKFEEEDEPVEMRSSKSLSADTTPPTAIKNSQINEAHDAWERIVVRESDLLNRRREGVMRGLQFAEA